MINLGKPVMQDYLILASYGHRHNNRNNEMIHGAVKPIRDIIVEIRWTIILGSALEMDYLENLHG